MSEEISRRHFIGSLLASTAGAIALSKLGEIATQLESESVTFTSARFIPAEDAAIATTADGNWVLILHPDWEQELRDLPPPDEEEKLVHGEWARLNTIKFRRSELLPDFQRPAPLQVFRGAKWKHEQRPYHKRFA